MSDTRDLLLRWHGGDQDALAAIVQQEADWMAAHVHRRLGARLRRRQDTQDIVQHTMLEVLRAGPRFVVSDRGQLRALLGRMVENVLRGRAHHDAAAKRDVRREIPPPPASRDSILMLDPPAADTAPDAAADRTETREWVRLALELLDSEDREIIVLRDFEGLAFAEAAQRLDLTEDAARMRYRRALPRLAKMLTKLRQGELGAVLEPCS
jgi:RNA polymerase sigma-70 factor (ECF subfamily)